MVKSKLPASIRIINKDFPLIKRDIAKTLDGDNTYGMIHHIRATIEYTPVSPSRDAEIIIHEMLHGLWERFDLDDAQEEHMVKTLATGITKVMQDNPTLFPALQGMVK